MSSKCEIISYTFKSDFNEDTFKGLNVYSEPIKNGEYYDSPANFTVDKGYVISKNKIYYITHANYTIIAQIDGIINIKLIDFPKDLNKESIEYINYFHDIKDFIFDELKLNKEKNLTIIIRNLDTNQIIITNGIDNYIFYKEQYNKILEKYIYNQFSSTFRCS